MSGFSDLRRINKWSEAQPHLEMLSMTVGNDIWPLLNTRGFAPFAICREVFCYVDYLGALFTGSTNNVGDRFRQYLRRVMGKVDKGYADRSHEIYQMYRNGPVHEFAPKVLKKPSGEELRWLSYHGPRLHYFEDWKTEVRHLRPLLSPNNSNVYYLPVSTPCLIQDLLSSIQVFINGPKARRELIRCWNKAACVLNEPKEFDFSIPPR